MNICIIGDGLTSLSLAKNLINKKINVHFYHKNKIKNLSTTRTIGISKNNLEFFRKEICKIPKKIFWKIKKIEIYSEKLEHKKLLRFENDKDDLFYMLKNDELYDSVNHKWLRDVKPPKKPSPSSWEAYKNFGRDKTNIDVMDWIKKTGSTVIP